MTIPKAMIEKAAKALPFCKNLADAERRLGGGMTLIDAENGDFKRDWPATAITWGLFDAWMDRPQAWPEGQEVYKADYLEAYACGRRLKEVKP